MTARVLSNINLSALHRVYGREVAVQDILGGYGASGVALPLSLKGQAAIRLQPSATATGLSIASTTGSTVVSSSDAVDIATDSGKNVRLRPSGKTAGLEIGSGDAGGLTRVALSTVEDALRFQSKAGTGATLLDVLTESAVVSLVSEDAAHHQVTLAFKPAAASFSSAASLGLGTDSPATQLHVVGTTTSAGPLHVTSSNPLELGSDVSGKVTTAGRVLYNGTTVDVHGAAATGATESLHLFQNVATAGRMLVNSNGTFPSSFDDVLTVVGDLNVAGDGGIKMAGVDVIDKDGNAAFTSVTVNGVPVMSASNPYLLKAFDPSTLTSHDGAMGGLKLSMADNTEFMVYSVDASVGAKSAAGVQSVASLGTSPRTGYHLRLRCKDDAADGFLFENSSEVALMSLTADTGDLHVKNSFFLPTSVVLGAGADLMTVTPHKLAVKDSLLEVVTGNGAFGKCQLSTINGDKLVLSALQASGAG